MASGEVTAITPCENDGSHDTVSPKVGVVITADVRVVRYRSSHSLGNCESRKCTIVTSLCAVVKESINTSLKSLCSSRSIGSCNAGSIKAPVVTTENWDQPVVHRSRKHHKLNCPFEFTSSRRDQIDHIVLLPYLGCTKRLKSPKSNNTPIFVKSSKSCEAVGKTDKAKTVKPFLSQTCTNGLSNNTQSEGNILGYQVLSPIKQLMLYSLEEYEYELPEGHNISNRNVRSFYLIQTPISERTIFSGDLQEVDFTREESQQNKNSVFPNRFELGKNIMGFDKEMFPPAAKLNPKVTRNVSILHRPKTRDKFTSTTSLDKLNFTNNLDKSIQGLLPYVSNGRDFPSEIVLKLVPKADALKSSLNEAANKEDTSQNPSEANLLAPRLNTETDYKKKSSKSFWNCFSSKKKKRTSDTGGSSDCSSNKEIYFPSIVEVHNDKNSKKNLNEEASDVYNYNDSDVELKK